MGKTLAVELKKNDDPVICYLDDARALARTRDLSGVELSGPKPLTA